MSGQRKQRAVLTCEECIRGRSGTCERCRTHGIPCRAATSEAQAAPRLHLPDGLDFSVLKLYGVVQDLQRRCGMSDADLAHVIRRHCAPAPPPAPYASLHAHVAATPVLDHYSRPGSAHSHLSHHSGSVHSHSSGLDAAYSPITPPDDALDAVSTATSVPVLAASPDYAASMHVHKAAAAVPLPAFSLPALPAPQLYTSAPTYAGARASVDYPSLAPAAGSSWMTADAHSHSSHGSGGAPAYLAEYARDAWTA